MEWPLAQRMHAERLALGSRRLLANGLLTALLLFVLRRPGTVFVRAEEAVLAVVLLDQSKLYGHISFDARVRIVGRIEALGADAPVLVKVDLRARAAAMLT